jgi:hypothetical protein
MWFVCCLCEENPSFVDEEFPGNPKLQIYWKSNNWYEYEEHMKEHHKGYSQFNHICHYKNCRSNDYITDHDFAGNSDWADCFRCNDEDEYRDHLLEAHSDIYSKLYCEECEVQCFTKLEFEKHCKTKEHRELANVEYECKDCQFKTKNPYTLQTHFKSKRHLHKDDKTDYTCEACEFSTSFKSVFERHCMTERHQRLVNGEDSKKYTCEACQFSSPYKSLYETHCRSKKHIQLQTENIDKKSFYCEDCKYSCSLKHHFAQHLRSIKHNKIVNNK